MSSSFIKLTDDQELARKAIFNKIISGPSAKKGQVLAPTSFGKTFVILSALLTQAYYTKTNTRKKFAGAALMLTPVLALQGQQEREMLSTRFTTKDNAGWVDVVFDVMRFDCEATLDTREIERFIENRKQNGVYPIILCTYKSAGKLKNLRFDIIACDEAHNTTSPENSNAIHNELDPTANRVFFTATPKYDLSENGTRGMQNVMYYGKPVYIMSYKRAVKKGLILPIKPIDIFCYGHGENKNNHLVDLLNQSKNIMREVNNKAKTGIPDKVLYVLDSVAEVQTIRLNWERIKLQTGANVYTAYSDQNSYYKNGTKIYAKTSEIKQTFLRMIAEDTEDCIIVHIETIGEGVNLPGITGVVVFPVADPIRILQNVGRAMRLLPEDRGLPHAERKKKFANVMFVQYNDDRGAPAFQKELLTALMRMSYEKYIEKYFRFDNSDYPAGLIPPYMSDEPENLYADNQTQLLHVDEDYLDPDLELIFSDDAEDDFAERLKKAVEEEYILNLAEIAERQQAEIMQKERVEADSAYITRQKALLVKLMSGEL